MRAIRFWVRAARRRHWMGIVVLAVLAGLGLGLTSVALTGARRAETSFARLQVATLAPDAGIPDVAGVPEEVIATVAADPSVTTLARWAFTSVRPDSVQEAGAFIGLDEPFLDEVYRPVVIEGRRSRPGTEEVMINEAMADISGLEAGDRVDLVSGFEDPQPLGRRRWSTSSAAPTTSDRPPATPSSCSTRPSSRPIATNCSWPRRRSWSA